MLNVIELQTPAQSKAGCFEKANPPTVSFELKSSVSQKSRLTKIGKKAKSNRTSTKKILIIIEKSIGLSKTGKNEYDSRILRSVLRQGCTARVTEMRVDVHEYD